MKKKLFKHMATSVMISAELLKECRELELIATNRENLYFHIARTNKVILHVEDDFCVLTDYMTTTVSSPKELRSLPHILSAIHFAVYQIKNKYSTKTRDWIMNSAKAKAIGHIIKYVIHGEECKIAGQTMDHLSETWNETDKNIQFKFGNVNKGSHRHPIFINTMAQLLQFIEAIRIYEKRGGRGYIFKKEK